MTPGLDTCKRLLFPNPLLPSPPPSAQHAASPHVKFMLLDACSKTLTPPHHHLPAGHPQCVTSLLLPSVFHGLTGIYALQIPASACCPHSSPDLKCPESPFGQWSSCVQAQPQSCPWAAFPDHPQGPISHSWTPSASTDCLQGSSAQWVLCSPRVSCMRLVPAAEFRQLRASTEQVLSESRRLSSGGDGNA